MTIRKRKTNNGSAYWILIETFDTSLNEMNILFDATVFFTIIHYVTSALY